MWYLYQIMLQLYNAFMNERRKKSGDEIHGMLLIGFSVTYANSNV